MKVQDLVDYKVKATDAMPENLRKSTPKMPDTCIKVSEAVIVELLPIHTLSLHEHSDRLHVKGFQSCFSWFYGSISFVCTYIYFEQTMHLHNSHIKECSPLLFIARMKFIVPSSLGKRDALILYVFADETDLCVFLLGQLGREHQSM